MMEQSPFWSTTSSQARLNSTSSRPLPLVLSTGQTSWARSQSWGRKFCNTVRKVWPSLRFSHRKHVLEFEALGLWRAGWWWCLGTWLQLPTQKCSSKWKWSAATGMASRRSSQKNSPIYGWPLSLVEKSLRCLSSDGVLARKEFDWPFPLTEKFYHKLNGSWRNWRAFGTFGTSMWLP